MTFRIQPSILSADFVNFERDFKSISAADGIHVDVMDGHFVPNLTFGIPMVKRMQEITELPLDVHLMIEDQDRWAVKFAELGVFSVTVHFEACMDPASVASQIKASGSRAGLAIKPGTEVSEIVPFVDFFDQILVMSVEPGFGGQSFIKSTYEKIEQTKSLLSGKDIWLQVDGGVDESNIAQLAKAGVDTFVAGSSVFKASNRNEQIELLRNLAQQSGHQH
jgi:ribulose-phosphate 3-epimerase